MEYEWDTDKALSNKHKHRVDFADAVMALEDEYALTIEDFDHEEQRFKTLGMGALLDVLFVVHVQRTEHSLRIISARKADKNEREYYYKGLNYE